MKAIAQDLNQRRIPFPAKDTRRGPIRLGWAVSTVRVILRNEKYAGVWVWNKTRFLEDPDSGRRRPVRRHVLRSGAYVLLRATHTASSPWTLVDFNDQRRARPTLIRHLLDHIPERKIPEVLIEFPPLGHEPLHEQLGTKQKPIPAVR